jgi:hypothetical protein
LYRLGNPTYAVYPPDASSDWGGENTNKTKGKLLTFVIRARFCEHLHSLRCLRRSQLCSGALDDFQKSLGRHDEASLLVALDPQTLQACCWRDDFRR